MPFPLRTTLLSAALVALCGLSGLTGCTSTGQKAQLVDKALDDPGRRAEMFEATLRVLDDHPEYVDELYAHTRQHDPTLERFLANTARDLKDPKLAQQNAKYLVQHPESLKQVQESVVDNVKTPEARAGMNQAMRERAGAIAGIVIDDRDTLRTILKATIEAVIGKPEARAVFIEIMQEESSPLVRLLASNPRTLKVLARAFVETGSDKKAFLGMLRDVGLKD